MPKHGSNYWHHWIPFSCLLHYMLDLIVFHVNCYRSHLITTWPCIQPFWFGHWLTRCGEPAIQFFSASREDKGTVIRSQEVFDSLVFRFAFCLITFPAMSLYSLTIFNEKFQPRLSCFSGTKAKLVPVEISMTSSNDTIFPGLYDQVTHDALKSIEWYTATGKLFV